MHSTVITVRATFWNHAIITNAYVAYTVPGTNTQDEVTAYVIGSIVPNTEISKSDTGAKNVIGQNVGKGFMPSTLIEWLALLAIVFIIFILIICHKYLQE